MKALLPIWLRIGWLPFVLSILLIISLHFWQNILCGLLCLCIIMRYNQEKCYSTFIFIMPKFYSKELSVKLKPHWTFGALLIVAFLVFAYFCVFQPPYFFQIVMRDAII
jgi:hypothetical protein